MSSKLLSHRPALTNMVKRIAVEAGELIMEYFDGIRDIGTIKKHDGSPVTDADKEAEKLIEAALLKALPDIPMIGEEAFAQGRRVNTSTQEYFWLVDPLDGTSAFIRGASDFTVNIALIHKREPVLGVIYAPELGELYAGCLNEDGTMLATRYYEESDNEKQIRTRAMPRDGITVISGGDVEANDARYKLLDQFKVKKVMRLSSSLKICRIASGKADIYPRFGPTCEWDTAAGHAILRAAGGDITDMHGKPLTYGGTHPELLNPNFIASSSDIVKYGRFAG